jgi:hypothetical protein
MNRKQFLKSLAILPVVGSFFGQKILAEEKEPISYKLAFINSLDGKTFLDSFYNKIGHIISRSNIISEENKDYGMFKFFDKNIIPIIGNYFYFFRYSPDPPAVRPGIGKNKYIEIIVGEHLNWWSPVKFDKNEDQFIIDINKFNDKSVYLTQEDKDTIYFYLKHNKIVEYLKKYKENSDIWIKNCKEIEDRGEDPNSGEYYQNGEKINKI